MLHLYNNLSLFCMASNSILMKHLIRLYELLKTRHQPQVSQSCQPRISGIREQVSRGEGPKPSLVEGCGCRF